MNSFISREVRIGNISIGGDQPIRVQSMCNTATQDVDATVLQAERLANIGCELVRITVPAMKDVKALESIVSKLRYRNIRVPVIADVHFKPEVALACVGVADKVRINPGNYTENFAQSSYNQEDTLRANEKIRHNILPLADACKKHGTAIRIGTNQGSLSRRMIHAFGHTPEALTESAMEFIRAFAELDFHQIVVSLKSSKPNVMVPAYFMIAR
ncbi:MAG: flavodoxin-dependent (E)-4-hydroxy-3-methylbut-2-enyl-diphosphate synthase, partial [Bacteroidetes bacterium]|nr:flavodoxin-dependent (E)-4-hydroxy-3-methylbut-2-enyl-diphosphate synthase [Bacteroidota bacterium]